MESLRSGTTEIRCFRYGNSTYQPHSTCGDARTRHVGDSFVCPVGSTGGNQWQSSNLRRCARCRLIMRLTGGRSATAITDNNGNYRFSNIESGSFYTITPELTNYHFSPANRSFSLVADKT